MKNPYFEGVGLARQSIKPTDEQQYDSMNKALLQLASSIGKRPMQNRSGFLNNISQFAPDFADANLAYQANQQQVEASNAKTLQEQINHEMKVRKYMMDQEQARSAQEERLWHRQHAENQLAESKRQHSNTNAYQKALLDYKTKKNQQNSYLDQIAPMIRTDSAFDKTGKEAKAAADFYSEVQDVKARYESLKTAMQEAGIDTTNPLAFKKAIREASSVLSSFTKDPKLRAVATKYADVQASNKRAMQTAEKALKDGALTNFTVKYGDQNDLFPNFNEASDIFETKLDHMLHDAGSGYDASELSMQLGRHINKKNYPEIKRWMTEQQQAFVQEQNSAADIAKPLPVTTLPMQTMPTEQAGNIGALDNRVLMYDPETGEKDYIPAQHLNEAIKDGLLVVE